MKFLDDDINELDITVDISGECEFTANDLNVNSDIEILNPDLHIATLDTDAEIRMQCHIERGKGYVPSTKNKKETDMIGVIPIDSIFSPIVRTNYEVGNIRVGNEMDHDSLTLEVTTDGSISAENAVAKAASIMISYLNYSRTSPPTPKSMTRWLNSPTKMAKNRKHRQNRTSTTSS